MTFVEEYRDLFTVPKEYYLCHCISADFALGAGIAVEFNKRFNMREKLRKYHPERITRETCILIDRVLNLVTKEFYYTKPTYDSLEFALKEMYNICYENNITKIAMPTIGCGLDGLKWNKVKDTIQKVFYFTDVDILVCKNKKQG